MTETATQLLAAFESLAPQEQHELLTALLRRSDALQDSFLTDDQLAGIATEAFLTLDAEESDATVAETE